MERKLRVFHNNLGMSVRVFFLVDFKIYIMGAHQNLLVLSYNLVQLVFSPSILDEHISHPLYVNDLLTLGYRSVHCFMSSRFANNSNCGISTCIEVETNHLRLQCL